MKKRVMSAENGDGENAKNSNLFYQLAYTQPQDAHRRRDDRRVEINSEAASQAEIFKIMQKNAR